MARHIIYIPGLGDGYDGIRRLGLAFWRRPGLHVTHVPMRWSDATETYDQKLARIESILTRLDSQDVTFVGESAGGSVVIALLRRYSNRVNRTVTVCGMNQGAGNVNPRLYQKNRAFHDAMVAADGIISNLSDTEKSKLLTIYSSHDYTVRPKDTLIDGVTSYDLMTPGHMVAILTVLFWRFRRITSR